MAELFNSFTPPANKESEKKDFIERLSALQAEAVANEKETKQKSDFEHFKSVIKEAVISHIKNGTAPMAPES